MFGAYLLRFSAFCAGIGRITIALQGVLAADNFETTEICVERA
jgi:hypothetical protein